MKALRFSALALLLTAPGWTQSQPGASFRKRWDQNAHGWFTYSGDHHLKGKWELHFDGHWRRADAWTDWQQLLIRPGINYAVNKTVTVGGGYASINTWPYGDNPGLKRFPEHRLYADLHTKHAVGGGQLSTRVRPEFRWVRFANSNGEYRYVQRVRLLGRFMKPIRGNWSWAVFDEIFLGYPPNLAPGTFDQNRAAVVLVRKLTSNTRVEAGYMLQSLAQRNGRWIEMNHTMIVTLVSRAKLFGR